MSFNLKKKLLSLISILNTIICCFYLGHDIIVIPSINTIVWDISFLILALIPYLLIRLNKRYKHLYFLTIFFALNAFLALNVLTFTLSLVAIIISLIETEEEKGVLVKILKRHPLILSLTVILSGVSFLSTGSIFEYFSKLTYGFNMLGELCATIFLFFMILVCKKGYLIYKNKGSIKEAIIVSLPFIVYSFYIGSSLLAMNLVEGYELVSIDNIITIIILYLLVGIFEDFLTRGLTLNILLDKFGKTKKGIWLSIFLSSLFFGLIHFVNLFTGASFQGVLIQVISATCIGMYFSAIYLRSGNVWAPALLHGIYDIAVSVPSFFYVKEIVDINLEYGEAISNYSWANLGVGVGFILLTLFLLRKTKMKNVHLMVNNQEMEKPKKDGALKYLLMGFGLGFTVVICYFSFMSMFEFDKYSQDIYNKIITSNDYQEDYILTYTNGYVDYDSISDETKLIMAVSNIGKLEDAEKNVKDTEIITYIEDYEISDSVKELFNKDKNINYVDFNYSYKTSCSYENDTFRYKCITTNNNQSNNLRVYSNISKVSLSGEATVELLVYYIVEDLDSNTLYADSNLNTVYRYNTSINDISNGIKYDENDNRNKEFWDNIKENNNGMIPTYKIKLDLNTLGDRLYFVSSEFVSDSIELKDAMKEEVIGNELYQYNSNMYSFTYDKAYFEIEEVNNSLLINYNKNIVLTIENTSSDMWLYKYKNSNGLNINIGNYTYYNINNEYLIYKDNFYVININTNDIEVNNKLLEILSTIEFK